jgi:4-amino-4-deoxy-L-arabinose transferase-like glycosyltransferase
VALRTSRLPLSSSARPIAIAPAAALLAVLAGIVLRAATFAKGQSFWLDESMLAVNIAMPGAPGRTLFFEQVAPPAFLWLSAAATAIGGVNEIALRTIPFVAGCLLLPLVWRIASRLFGDPAAAVATWAAAVSPALIAYSAELKPYALEALATAAIVDRVIAVARDPSDRRQWLGLAITGVAALAASVSAVFVLAAALGGLLLVPGTGAGRRPSRDRLLRVATTGALWLATFAAVFAAVYRVRGVRAYMARYWSHAFLGGGIGEPGPARLIIDGVLSPFFINEPGGLFAVLLGGALAAGVTAAGRRGTWVVAMLGGPFALAIAASAAHQYPFAGRLVLFLAPLACVLVGAGAAECAELVSRAVRATSPTFAVATGTLVAGAVVLVGAAREAIWFARFAEPAEDPRAVVREVVGRAAPGEPVYLYAQAIPSWLIYSTDWRKPDDARLRAVARAASTLGPNSGNVPPRGREVRGEGDSLRVASSGRVELLGLPPGIETLALVPGDSSRPDPGWGANEVRRILGERRPRAWIYLSHYRDPAAKALLAELDSAGGRVLAATARRQAAAYYVDLSAARARASGGAKVHSDVRIPVRLTPPPA